MKRAIIIGAGPAGLTAAYRLLKETDVHPVVLEAGSTVGGLSRTVVRDGLRLDIGGHRFFSKNDEVMNFWTETMPLQGAPASDDAFSGEKKPFAPGGPDPEKEDRVMLIRRRVSRILYRRKFFDYPISPSPATIWNLGLLRTFSSALGYVRARVFPRPERTLKDFMINRFGEPLYRMFFERYTEKVWGRNPEAISADWGAQRIRGLSLSKAALEFFRKLLSLRGEKETETSLIGEFLYPKKGPGQLWETLADDVRAMGGEILLNAEAQRIHAERGRILSATCVHDGREKEFQGDFFLSSMPVKELVERMEPGGIVPADVRSVAAGLPYRDFIVVGVLADALKIRNRTKRKTLNGIAPDCWIYIQEPDVKISRLQIFNNWSPYLAPNVGGKVWLGLEYFCTEGDELWNMPERDFIRFALKELETIGILEPNGTEYAFRIREKKAYPAYFGTYGEFGRVREFLNGFSNLYCIGRNGQHRYNNMDHSMLTAMEAVRSIREGKGPGDELWSVNADEEYHEERTARRKS